MSNSILLRFTSKVLMYLVPLFAVWYYLAPWYWLPLVSLADLLMQLWLPDFIMWVKLQGSTVVVATQYGLNAAGTLVTPPFEEATGFTLNPLSFGYSLPLFLALLLATPLPHKFSKLFIGTLIILSLQWLSLVSCVLKSLTFEMGAVLQQALQWSALQLDVIALSYQVGFLLLPMIAPLVVWALLSQSFLSQLAPQLNNLNTHTT